MNIFLIMSILLKVGKIPLRVLSSLFHRDMMFLLKHFASLLKPIKKKKANAPWFNKSLRNDIAKRNQFFFKLWKSDKYNTVKMNMFTHEPKKMKYC